MFKWLKVTAVLLALAIAGAASAWALDTQPDQFEQKLKSYDPETVEAARAYARTFDLKGMMEKSAPRIAAAVATQLKAKNPTLNDEQTKLFIDTFMQSGLVDSSDVLEQASIILMLEIFTKDELVALNQFYSSPVGAGILKKFPVMMGRMPEIMQVVQTYIIPRALEAARSTLHARGVEVKI
jgi:hypothetical protein